MKNYFLFIFSILFFIPTIGFADSDAIDFLRNSGKIYSVFAVIMILFLGIMAYLIRLDKKIKQLEKKQKDGY